jgi:ERF superfamily
MPRAKKTEVATIQHRTPSTEAQQAFSLIERVAGDPSIPIERLERLMAMRDAIVAKDNEDAFNEVMALAQAEMKVINADAENDSTKSKYATYAAVDRAARPIYSKYGFGLSFDEEDSPKAEHVRVVCYVTACKHTRKYRIDMPADGKGAKGGDVMTKTHATGSAFAYGQRYLVKNIFNLAIDRDDDGNKAGKVTLPMVTDEQLKNLQKLAKDGKADLPKFCTLFRIKTLNELPAALYDEAVKQLQRKVKAAAQPKQEAPVL